MYALRITKEIKKNSEIPITDTNERDTTKNVTGYKLQDDKKTTPTNTQTQPPDTPTTTKIIPEEIFETKIHCKSAT